MPTIASTTTSPAERVPPPTKSQKGSPAPSRPTAESDPGQPPATQQRAAEFGLHRGREQRAQVCGPRRNLDSAKNPRPTVEGYVGLSNAFRGTTSKILPGQVETKPGLDTAKAKAEKSLADE